MTRIVVYGRDRRVGLWEGGEVIDANGTVAKRLREAENEPHPYELAAALVPATLRGFIEGGTRAIDELRKAADHLRSGADREGLRGERLVFAEDSVRLHPPLATPGQPIACLGANYAAHSVGMRGRDGDARTLEEVRADLRKVGLVSGKDETGGRPVGGFWKLTDTIGGHEDEVLYPVRSQRFDYEGEVSVVIGRRAKDVAAADADAYVWGATIHADYSLRDGDDTGNRTFRHAKNFDTSSALGPSIAVGDLEPQDIDLETHVNGELRQQYNSSGMTFTFAEIIEYLSRHFSLMPGFVISGGCGPGTAAERKDPNGFLRPGDVVEYSSPRIGRLRNRIVGELSTEPGTR